MTTRLHLEVLEIRDVPATTVLSGSTLTISNPRLVFPNTSLQVTQLADGRFQVQDSTSSPVTFSGVANIVIHGSNFHDSIKVTLAATKRLTGNLTINGNNGDDTVTIDTGAGSTGTENVGGNTTLDLGNGNDSVNIGTTRGVTLSGNTTVRGGFGNDSVTIGNAAVNVTTLRGNLDLFAVQGLKLGQGKADQVGGNLTMDLLFSPTSSSEEFNTVNLTAGIGTVIGGFVDVFGGVLADSVTLGGASVGPNTGAEFHFIDLSEGGNKLSLNTTIFGDVDFFAGDGNDTVAITAASNILGSGSFGNLFLFTGDGDNDFTGMTGAFNVFGDLIILAGFPATAAGQNITLGANVGGDLDVHLGNGDNSFTLNGTVGATFFYNVSTPSTGNNVVTINTGTNSFDVEIEFGNQTSPTPNNQLILTGTGTVSGFLDWGENNVGDDVFSPGAVDISGLIEFGDA